MALLLYLLLFFFIFRGVGNFLAKFFLNGGHNINNKANQGNFNTDFSKIFQEMLKNMHASQQAGPRQEYKQQNNNNYSTGNKSMSKKEACEILGVEENAAEIDIKKAYHKLMLKVHPDSGGSKYLSQRVNEAKDILIGK